MREITRLFHVMFAVYFREGESECRRVVFDVFGVDVRLFNMCLMFVFKKKIYIYMVYVYVRNALRFEGSPI